MFSIQEDAEIQYQRGRSCIEKEDYAEAFKHFYAAAQQGHIDSQFFVGLGYEYGDGVARDSKEAEKWYRKAAKQGNPKYQNTLAKYYIRNNDYTEAIKWLHKAAQKGHADSQYMLGGCYFLASPKNDSQDAKKLYTISKIPKSQVNKQHYTSSSSAPSQGSDYTIPGLGSKLIYVAPGSFQMGSNLPGFDTSPMHKVTITKPFWLGATEVTDAQMKKIFPYKYYTPLKFTDMDDDIPATGMTWYLASKFCKELTKKAKKLGQLPAGYVYRLPTEAEWEYACRAGSQTNYYFGDDLNLLSQYEWHKKNSPEMVHSVASLKPNQWGFYDISGNAIEWCNDLYEKRFNINILVDP